MDPRSTPAPSGESQLPRRDEAQQGFRWEGDDGDVLARIIDVAFDYRGDVTLLLRSGDEIHGYLSNRNRDAPEPFADVLPALGGSRVRVYYRDVRGVSFTGRDTASGKSWENWAKRYRAKKEAEARGESIQSIDLFPDSID